MLPAFPFASLSFYFASSHTPTFLPRGTTTISQAPPLLPFLDLLQLPLPKQPSSIKGRRVGVQTPLLPRIGISETTRAERRRKIIRARSPNGTRTRPQDDFESTAVEEDVVGEVVFGVRLAIKGGRLDVLVSRGSIKVLGIGLVVIILSWKSVADILIFKRRLYTLAR